MSIVIALTAGVAVGVLYGMWQYGRVSRGAEVIDLYLLRNRDGSMWGGRDAVSIWGGPAGIAVALGLFWAIVVINVLLFAFSLLQWL